MKLELRGDYLRGDRTELEKTGFRSGSYGGGQWVSANRFWLEVDVRGFEVRPGVESSGGSAFSDIFAWSF